MFDPDRLWVVTLEATGCTTWLVIADNEGQAKDAAQELEADVSFSYDAQLASIRKGALASSTDMGANDDVIIADYDKDDEISLSELRAEIQEWYQQKQREYRERNNGQTELPLC
jgi:hypothetical protein